MSGKYAKFFALGLFLLFLGAGCASEPGLPVDFIKN